MKVWIKKAFDNRPTGTDMSHLDNNVALSLLEKGLLTEIDPSVNEVKSDIKNEKIISEEVKNVKPAQRGRKPNKK